MEYNVIKEPFWSFEIDETLEALETRKDGLADEEAQKRIELFGPNTIIETPPITKLEIIGNQLKSPLIVVLIVAGLLSGILNDWIETAMIAAALIINTALGFWQENKAETALQLLQSYIRIKARVRRAGKEREIDAAELAPGDVIRITQGDRIPADGRIIFANNFEVDESIITGESLPVAKTTAPVPASTLLGERKCMVLNGTLAMQGFADIVVTATGAQTEFGRIAGLVAGRRRELTPLQRMISRFSKQAGIVLGVLTIFLFGFGVYTGKDIYEMFLIAVAVAVSAVPEGLPIALTAILAIGVQKLAAKRAIVRKLIAAETLGSTTLILTDKTGTLTQAKMELAAAIPRHPDSAAEKTLLEEALLNTDVVIENPGDPYADWKMFGRPLEISLVRAAASRGILYPGLERAYKIHDRLPFTSDRKFAITIYHHADQTHMTLLGAPEILLKACQMDAEERARIEENINQRAYAGERVLGVASRAIEQPEAADIERFIKPAAAGKPQKLDHLDFKGLITFRDPLRPGVGAAIRSIAATGVETVIVTGDHRGTAESVARELGMIDGAGLVLSGEDLAHLSDEELAAIASRVKVYARVTPEQKVRITNIYKMLGETVAVTGDGINDAPALRNADIGIAVGSGTEVAKAASDIVILDDNYETIVTAIEGGRKMVENIRKVIVYLLSDALDELFLIGGSLVMGLALPLNALQILFVNFFSDSFPAIGLAFEDGVDHVGRKPKHLGRALMDSQMQLLILVIGTLSSFFLFALYVWLLAKGYPPELIRTFIFGIFASYTLFLAFAVRSLEKSIFGYNPLANRSLTLGVGVGLALTLAVIYLPPLQNVFGTVALPISWLGAGLAIGMFNILAIELAKFLFRRGLFTGQR